MGGACADRPLGMVGLTLRDIFGQPKPDYRIAVVTRYNIAEEATDQLTPR